MLDYLKPPGSPSATQPSLTGLPRYNANTISDFLRQQLAERAKRRGPGPSRTTQPTSPLGGISQLFGVKPNGR